MKTIHKLSAALSAGAMAIGLAGAVFAQSDNTNSLIAPASPPSYPSSEPYGVSRQAYMEEAGRQWDAMARRREVPPPYVGGPLYGDPYARDWRDWRVDSGERSYPPFRGPGIPAGHDSNPNDYEAGIYNPKP